MSGQPHGGIGLGSVPLEYRRRGYRHTVSWAFYGIFFAIVAGLGPFVIRQLGGSALQCLMIDLGLAGPQVFALVWGTFLRRRNPVRLTGLLLGLGGVLVLFSGLTPGLWSLALVLTGGMFFLTLSRPSLGVALRQVYPDQWRGKLLSLPNTAATLVRGVCLVAVGSLLTRDIALYRWVFPAAGASLLVGGVLFRRIRGSRGIKPSAEQDAGRGMLGQVRHSVRMAFGNRALLLFLLGYFVTACGAVAAQKVMPLFANDELGLTTQQWGYAQAGFLAAMLVSFYAWGILMDRIGAPLTVMISWIFQCVIFAALFFVRSWPVFFWLVAARGFFQAGNWLAFFPLVIHFTSASETQHGMGLHFTLWGIRWGLVTLLVAWVVDARLFPMRYIFPAGALLVAAGIVIMVLVWHKYGRTAASEAA